MGENAFGEMKQNHFLRVQTCRGASVFMCARGALLNIKPPAL